MLYGDEVQSLFKNAKVNAFALPAVNVKGSSVRTVTTQASEANRIANGKYER